ncbi:MAG: hypothetical protein WBA85_02870, partial [Brucella anthropi]
FYTHAPQRAHNPKGGQQKETIQRNNPPTNATRHQPKTKSKPAVRALVFFGQKIPGLFTGLSRYDKAWTDGCFDWFFPASRTSQIEKGQTHALR